MSRWGEGWCGCGVPAEATHLTKVTAAKDTQDAKSDTWDIYHCAEHVGGYSVGEPIQFGRDTWTITAVTVTNLKGKRR